MKKKILGSMVAVAIAAIAAVNVNIQASDNGVATIGLSNVEALASGESPDCSNGCYDNGSGCYCHVWYPSYREAG